jgi:peroxiredoxin Q/BCP
MTAPEIGSPAPEVDLEGWHEGSAQRFVLSEQRGHPVVLAFYPGDSTQGCTKQLCSYSDDWDLLTASGAVLWGISVQDLDSKRRFAERRSLRMPLLADVDRAAHRAYGVDRSLVTKRSVFVVDAEGILRWSHVSTLGLTHQSAETLASVVADLQPA